VGVGALLPCPVGRGGLPDDCVGGFCGLIGRACGACWACAFGFCAAAPAVGGDLAFWSAGGELPLEATPVLGCGVPEAEAAGPRSRVETVLFEPSEPSEPSEPAEPGRLGLAPEPEAVDVDVVPLRISDISSKPPVFNSALVFSGAFPSTSMGSGTPNVRYTVVSQPNSPRPHQPITTYQKCHQ
jgi:hypothetical protein